MARIPMGDFGQAVADVRPTPTPSAAQLDGGLSEAAQRLGNTAAGIGENMLAAQRAEELRLQRKAEAEAERKQREAEELRKRIDTANAHGRAQNAIRDFSDEVQDGVTRGGMSYDDARKAFKERGVKLVDDALKDFNPDIQDLVRAQMVDFTGLQANRLEDTIRKNTAQNIDAGLIGFGEQMQRLATSDPATAVKQYEAGVNEMGAAAGWSPERIAKAKQGFRENVTFTQAYTALSNARGNRGAIDAVMGQIAKLGDLDPQKKAQLMDRGQVQILALDQKAEVAAARAERQAEARLKRAEASFNVFQGLADKGTVMDPVYVDAALAQTAGTPYQGGIRALAEQAKETGGVAAQPVPVQRAMLDAVNVQIAKNGRSPALDKRKDQLEKVLRGSQQDYKDDPMRAGLERGVITTIEPIDISNPQALAGSIGKRLEQSQVVSVAAGQNVSPLTSDEAGKVRDMLNLLQPKMRSQAIATLAQTLGPKAASGLARQLDSKDEVLGLAFGMASSATTAGRYTSELVLKGAAALADKTAGKDDAKVTGWKATIAQELDGAYPNQMLADKTKSAAWYIAAGISAENGGSLSSRQIREAVTLAAGGQIVEHNGGKVPLPAGMDADMLEQRLRAVSAAELGAQAPGGKVRAAGVDMPVADFVKTLPGQQLMYAGPGRYAVIVKGRPVTNAEGKPIMIGVQ